METSQQHTSHDPPHQYSSRNAVLFSLSSSIDATDTKDRLGHLVNDAKEGTALHNAKMKRVVIKHQPRLALYASRDIESGEEVAYDYGDDEGNLWWRRMENKQVGFQLFENC